jgi:NitT/TauT family transport system substrate-binding protein
MISKYYLSPRSKITASQTIVLILLLLSAGGFAQTGKITFTPHWIPQAQFAGYYAALDQGFYKEAGLDVKILHLTANISSFEYLKNGKADIVSSFLMDAVRQKSVGVPIVNIGQLSQHSALMMVTKKESGIDEAKKLHNKTLGIWSSGFDDVPIAFMRERNYNIELVRVLNTVNLFLMDGVDALTVMYYNEYDQVINSGVNEDELNTFFFSDYGLDIPEDGLYCLESTLLNRREELTKFVQATLKGWEFAGQNREYTIGLVVQEMTKAHLPNNKAHQRWMLDRMLELIQPGEKNIKMGHLAEQDFYRAVNIFRLTSPDFSTENFLFENFYKPLLSP